jgi:hypothetical protein
MAHPTTTKDGSGEIKKNDRIMDTMAVIVDEQSP